MTEFRWMLYGATGYTGPLIAEEAVKRGHRPLLAGRSVEKLAALSERLDLDYVVFPLDDVNIIAEAIAEIDVVLHAAGPFLLTSEPMALACLATKTHYLDLAGEIDVYERIFAFDDAARKTGIALIPGVGFDVIPSDCLANHVARKVPGATHLETAVLAIHRFSAGTAKSFVEMLPLSGGRIRRDGKLQAHPIGGLTKRVRFSIGEMSALSVPWGDIAAAYRSTGIPDITSYMGLPAWLIPVAKFSAPFGQWLFRSKLARRVVNQMLDIVIRGPDEHYRERTRSYVWACAYDRAGNRAEAWLDTLEAYRFTAVMAVRSIEQMAVLNLRGALTPAQAFGVDFVLEAADTRRFDSLD
jgi:short subunit dehydrogenase-like uncharacterized protein